MPVDPFEPIAIAGLRTAAHLDDDPTAKRVPISAALCDDIRSGRRLSAHEPVPR